MTENQAVPRARRLRGLEPVLHQHGAGVRAGEVPGAARGGHLARLGPAAAARGQLRRRLPRLRRVLQPLL